MRAQETCVNRRQIKTYNMLIIVATVVWECGYFVEGRRHFTTLLERPPRMKVV